MQEFSATPSFPKKRFNRIRPQSKRVFSLHSLCFDVGVKPSWLRHFWSFLIWVNLKNRKKSVKICRFILIFPKFSFLKQFNFRKKKIGKTKTKMEIEFLDNFLLPLQLSSSTSSPFKSSIVKLIGRLFRTTSLLAFNGLGDLCLSKIIIIIIKRIFP